MKRLDNGEGSSPLLAVRLPLKTMEQLDALVANMPPHPVAGPPPRLMVVRGVIEAGIATVASREGIKLAVVGAAPKLNGSAPKPAKKKKLARKRRVLKGSEFDNERVKTVHRASRARAEKRAAVRLAAGCTCASRHVPACKLYHAPATA